MVPNKNYNQILNDLKSKYNITNIQFLQIAKYLVSDINYIKEHFSRTRKSNYDICVLPTLNNNINGNFIKEIFYAILKFNLNLTEDECIKVLSIIELSKKIINNIYNNLDPLTPQNVVNSEDIKSYIELEEIIEYYYRINLWDYIYCFIGCSRGCDGIITRINFYKYEINQQDNKKP